MAYFATGADCDDHVAKYYDRCIHGTKDLSCPVFVLHFDWNYDVGRNETKRMALNTLWPMKPDDVYNADCAMFHAADSENSAGEDE